MWNKEKLHSALYWAILCLAIVGFAFVVKPADADDEHYQSDVWNSGKIDGRLGLDPSGQDMSDAYMLEYMEGREEARHEELLNAIEEARDE